METGTSTTTQAQTESPPGDWKGGVVAGLLGGVVYGIVLSVVHLEELRVVIPMLVGLEGPVAGWTVHLAISAVWGVVFAGVAGALDAGDDVARSVGVGLAFGAAIYVLDVVILLPLWMHGVIGFAEAPAFPAWSWVEVWTHLSYGLVAGAVYPFLDDL